MERNSVSRMDCLASSAAVRSPVIRVLGIFTGLVLTLTNSPALAQASAPSSQTSPSFTDIDPDHWAYQAVQRLVNNYGCLAGYPDDSFRGDQLVSRYEFAAGLNACLEALRILTPADAVSRQEVVDALRDSLDAFQQEPEISEQDLPASEILDEPRR